MQFLFHQHGLAKWIVDSWRSLRNHYHKCFKNLGIGMSCKKTRKRAHCKREVWFAPTRSWRRYTGALDAHTGLQDRAVSTVGCRSPFSVNVFSVVSLYVYIPLFKYKNARQILYIKHTFVHTSKSKPLLWYKNCQNISFVYIILYIPCVKIFSVLLWPDTFRARVLVLVYIDLSPFDGNTVFNEVNC